MSKHLECKWTDYNELPISFARNDIDLLEEDEKALDQTLYEIMKDRRNIRIEISSHTDARGDCQLNRELSQKRAEAVIEYLIKKGIQRSRLVAKGYGEERLKNKCHDGVDCTEEEHAENERTEFRVLSN